MIRQVVFSSAFREFFNAQPTQVQEKFDYGIRSLREVRVLTTKLVKKLTDTDFYELRISMDNEYRVILCTIDHTNIMEAKRVILLNGFVKKSTKDYKRQINIAIKLSEELQ